MDLAGGLHAASDGDRIRVAAGDYCGAVVTKRVTLDGHGYPRIITEQVALAARSLAPAPARAQPLL